MAEYSREWLAAVDQRFGQRMHEERQARGISQQQLVTSLATLHDVRWHQSTVTKAEAGTRPVRLFEALAIAATLGVSLDDLLDDPESPDAKARRAAREEGRLYELSYLMTQLRARMNAIYHGKPTREEGDDGERQEAP
jgi:transcriptional regulator with XRE-family HTH domain